MPLLCKELILNTRNCFNDIKKEAPAGQEWDGADARNDVVSP